MGEYGLGYGDAAGALSLDLTTDVIPTDARDSLLDYAQKFATSVVGDERTALLDMIGTAIDQGTGADKLGAAIRGHFDEGIHRLNSDGKPTLVQNMDAWTQTVARTELARAYTYGSRTLYEDAGYDEWQWAAAGDDRACALCLAADGTSVKIGEDFPEVGVDQPPAHPDCLCTTIADPASRQAADEIDSETADSAAHGNYGADVLDNLEE